MRSDPNGHPWLDWKKYGYTSHEAFIESKAGANPVESSEEWEQRVQINQMPPQPPREGPDPHLAPEWLRATHSRGDWPQELPPPFMPPDDEGRAEPGARDD